MKRLPRGRCQVCGKTYINRPRLLCILKLIYRHLTSDTR